MEAHMPHGITVWYLPPGIHLHLRQLRLVINTAKPAELT